MSVFSLDLIKLELLSKNAIFRAKLEEREIDPPTDPKLLKISKLLAKMEEADRSYYIPLLQMVRAYTGYEFPEIHRERERRPEFWSGTVQGVFLVSMGYIMFGGQLRYRLMTNSSAKQTLATPKQICDFVDYMRTFETSRGNIEVDSMFKEYNYSLVKNWDEISEYFTPEETENLRKIGIIPTKEG